MKNVSLFKSKCRFVLLGVVLITTYFCQAQIGIKTPNVTSTLTVDGSFAGKYTRVNSSTYQLSDQEYSVAYLGTQDGVITLPRVEQGANSIAGRMYFIKNLNLDKNVKIATATGQSFHYGGKEGDFRSIILRPGQYAILVANNVTTSYVWDVNVVGSMDIVKMYGESSVEYEKRAIQINDNTPEGSEVMVSGLRVRFNGISATQGVLGYIEFKPTKENSSVVTWSTKMGKGNTTTPVSCYGEVDALMANWTKLCKNEEVQENGISPYNSDFAVAYISNYTTNEMYRITVNAHGPITNTGTGFFNSSATVTLVVEKLN